jgi:hypothetical protein
MEIVDLETAEKELAELLEAHAADDKRLLELVGQGHAARATLSRLRASGSGGNPNFAAQEQAAVLRLNGIAQERRELAGRQRERELAAAQERVKLARQAELDARLLELEPEVAAYRVRLTAAVNDVLSANGEYMEFRRKQPEQIRYATPAALPLTAVKQLSDFLRRK